MAGWGVMMGLGQSLQQVGGMISDYNKTKLADKLEQGREQRAQARELEREQRQQLQFDKAVPEVDSDGVTWMTKYNKAGNVMEKTLAPKNVIDDLNFQRSQRQNSLEEDMLDIGAKRRAADDYDTLLDLKVRGAEADIAATNARERASDASAFASRARGTKALDNSTAKSQGSTPSPSEISNALMENYSAEIEDMGVEPARARDLANKIALELINRAKSGDPKDPGDTFLRGLQILKARGLSTQSGLETALKKRKEGS